MPEVCIAHSEDVDITIVSHDMPVTLYACYNTLINLEFLKKIYVEAFPKVHTSPEHVTNVSP